MASAADLRESAVSYTFVTQAVMSDCRIPEHRRRLDMITPPSGTTSPAAYVSATVAAGIVVVAAVAWIAWSVVKGQRSLSFLLIMVGSAALLCLPDAIVVALTNLQYFPSTASPVVIEAFGRPQTPFPLVAWMAWGCSMGYAAIVVVERDWPMTRIWSLYAAIVVLDVLAELVMIHVWGLYTYFGSQPWTIFGVPFVWPFAYVGAIMLVGLPIRYFQSYVTGYWRVLLVFVAPGVYTAVMAATVWPSFLAVGADLSAGWSTLIGLVSVLLVLVVFHLAMGFFRDWARRHQRPSTLEGSVDIRTAGAG